MTKMRFNAALPLVGVLLTLACASGCKRQEKPGAAGAGAGFKHFTGWEGVVCGLSAIYTGLAQVLNEVYGETVLPG